MKKIASYVVLSIAFLAIGVVYGIAIHKYHVFPYNAIRSAWDDTNASVKKRAVGPWSIGIYEGPTPFDLVPAASANNPVLSYKDVNDADPIFVADPFMVPGDDGYVMFIEVAVQDTDQGDIGYATSTDAMSWDYQGIIINEVFHLSYPRVVSWDGEFLMVPESFEDSIRAPVPRRRLSSPMGV